MANTLISHEEFESIAQKAFESLPIHFRKRIENVIIVIEDYPSPELLNSMRISKYSLLGLYQGVPLSKRTTSYGMYPVTPDKISLYMENILSQCRTKEEIENRIREVLFHEIGHYFGMNEKEIRDAMKDFK